MKRYGLIGFPLGHSFSPKFFEEKFKKENIIDSVYELFPLENIEDFPLLIEKYPDLCGLNITIPYKSEIFSFLDSISPEALDAGAVNTIKFVREHNQVKLHGFNTDIPAFSAVLAPQLTTYHHTALIFGTGGAAKAVAYALRKMGIDYYFISRTVSDRNAKILRYDELKPEHIKSIKLLINTTPLGQMPDPNHCVPIDYDEIDHLHILFDLIYNPAQTLFLKKGFENGATTLNGQKMLELQAEAAWKIWQS